MLILDPTTAMVPPLPAKLVPDDLAGPQAAPRPRVSSVVDIAPAVMTLSTRMAARLTRPEPRFGSPADSDESVLDSALRLGSGVIGVTKIPVQSAELAFAIATKSLAAGFNLPAATISMKSLHFGIAHYHLQTQPLPVPMLSFGWLFLGGAQSVIINGCPGARVGDMGLARTCATMSPFFKVTTGSSKVFFGPNRAARSLDLTVFCKKPSPKVGLDKLPGIDSALNIANTALRAVTSVRRSLATGAASEAASDKAMAQSLAAESKGHALAAAVQTKHAATSALLRTTDAFIGADPCTTKVFPGVLAALGGNVLIGGFPMPPTLKLIVGLKKVLTAEIIGGALDYAIGVWVFSPVARWMNALGRDLRHYTGHPVDVITGNLVLDATDVDLPGALPLRFTRAYSSSWSARDSPLGRGWSHSLDEAIWLEPRHLVYRTEDGRELEFPRNDELETYNPLHRLTLRRLAPDRWQIEDHHGIRRDFAAVVGDPRPAHARLIQRRDRAGHSLHLRYDDRARLISAHTDDARELRLHYGDDGRLIQLDLPDPAANADAFLPHVRYVHHGETLVEIHDAIGQITRYGHDHHRISKETFPNGLCFHFAYDSDAHDAACVRTWGDGGILDHRLIYDRPRRTTLVINSCNETTTYRADPRGLVTEIVDARGATTRFEYDALLQLTATTDALGHITRREYDARGNLTRETGPDGATVTTEYHPKLNLPVARTDANGAVTRWTYDAHGRVLRHTDPLGRSTVHQHELSAGGTHIEAIVHPDGRSELRTHDSAGRLLRHRPPDGSDHFYKYDRRGLLRRRSCDRDRGETRDYDLLGRLTRHRLPNGDTRLYTHDARGRIIRACDDRNDLRCGYSGLGWLTTCGDASASPCTFERDLEGRISRVAGPAGTLLRIERDPAGHVRSTVDSLGVERRYTRDLLGHVLEIRRPGGKITRYTRDAAARITAVDHGDNTLDTFEYRADGLLHAATRQHPDGQITAVRREFDALGRLLREHQDQHVIAQEYDLSSRPTRLRSSLGADLRFVHDERGLARVELPHELWALAFERDRDGREQTRHLPGEILSWWQSDDLGRPLEHGIVASHPPQIHRQRSYDWSGPRLQNIEETARRRPPPLASTPSVLAMRHDAEGRRVAADLSDGTSWSYLYNGAGELTGASCGDTNITYRHDALGRRIARSRDGIETRWLWHADVPLHSWVGQLGHDATTWVFEPGGFTPLARLTATTRHAFVSDHLGTPLAAFDERGALAWSAEFDAQGQPRTSRGDASLCPFRFPGQISDPDTALSYNRFREYDPATGRYLSPDPLGLLGGLDPHAYVDDPRTQTDVFGLTTSRPTTYKAYIAAELTRVFTMNDVLPVYPLLVSPLFGTPDLYAEVVEAYQTPHRGPCQ